MATSPPLLVKWLCLALGRSVEDQPDLIAQVPAAPSLSLRLCEAWTTTHVSMLRSLHGTAHANCAAWAVPEDAPRGIPRDVGHVT